jgi:acetyl-CoA decarbonylase/synthase complex subunit epsilon
LLIVGHEAADFKFKEEKLTDYLIGLAKNAKIPVVATAYMQGEFFKKGFQIDACMPLVDIANRLVDPEWKGLDGQGSYDLAIFIGIPYYIEWLILSSMKHFSPDLKTICIGMHYQPHASWSFPNLPIDEWEKNLKVIVQKMENK